MHWLYWVAPVAGMVAGMQAYERLRDARVPDVPRELPLGVEGPIAGSRQATDDVR